MATEADKLNVESIIQRLLEGVSKESSYSTYQVYEGVNIRLSKTFFDSC